MRGAIYRGTTVIMSDQLMKELQVNIFIIMFKIEIGGTHGEDESRGVVIC